MAHRHAIKVIEYIERSWGEDLSAELADDIASASEKVLNEFFEGWPGRDRSDPTAVEPEEIQRGETRPVLGASWDLEREKRAALALLLYVPSVSLSADLINLRWYLNPENFAPLDGRARMRKTLEWLAHVRPLIIDGSIHFGGGNLGYQNFAWRGEVFDRLVSSKKKAWRGTRLEGSPRSDRERELLALGQILVRPLGEVVQRRGTVVGLNLLEDAAYRAVLGSGVTDTGQAGRLARLAEYQLPALKVEAADVITIRSADSLTQWRTSLASALREAACVETSDRDIKAARDIVSSELGSSFDGVRREVESSNGLSRLRIGWRGIGIGALTGAANATLWHDPLIGAATSATLSAAGGVIDGYLTAMKQLAESKAIWDTVLSFKEIASSPSD